MAPDQESRDAMEVMFRNVETNAAAQEQEQHAVTREDNNEPQVTNTPVNSVSVMPNVAPVVLQPKTKVLVDDDPEDEETPINSEISSGSGQSNGSQSSEAVPQQFPREYQDMLDGKAPPRDESSSGQSSGAAPQRQMESVSSAIQLFRMDEKEPPPRKEEHVEVQKREDEVVRPVAIGDLQAEWEAEHAYNEWEAKRADAPDEQLGFSSAVAMGAYPGPPPRQQSALPTVASFKPKPEQSALPTGAPFKPKPAMSLLPLQTLQTAASSRPSDVALDRQASRPSVANAPFVPPPAAQWQGSPPSIKEDVVVKSAEPSPKAGGIWGFAKRMASVFTPKLRKRTLLDQTRTCERKWLAESKQVITYF